MLASSGFAVRVVATTATELAERTTAEAVLAAMGISPERRKESKSRTRPELAFEHRGVGYRLLDTGDRDMHSWQKLCNRQFDLMFDDELGAFRPDILLCYGGMPVDCDRYERARRKGVRPVLALHNEGYLSRADFFRHFHAALTPSRYLSGVYLSKLGIRSTALPIPLELEDVVAEGREAIFTTMINPSAEKGLMLVARLAEEIGIQRPDLAMLFIESRGSAGRLVQAGMAGGFDLRRHENLMLSPSVARPREIYAATRTLLVPSLWNEPAGRVAAEALLNGIPPLVSDRGGLPEVCNGAGFVLEVPRGVTERETRPVEAIVVQKWVELIGRLEDDEEFYLRHSELAREAGEMYRPDQLMPRYAQFFGSVAQGYGAGCEFLRKPLN
jgi:glycosyltransferase involved in cell wall biosynthesis